MLKFFQLSIILFLEAKIFSTNDFYFEKDNYLVFRLKSLPEQLPIFLKNNFFVTLSTNKKLLMLLKSPVKQLTDMYKINDYSVKLLKTTIEIASHNFKQIS